MSSSDCPICLETMVTAEEIFTLPCHKCEYNFCTTCIKEFIRSSKDDYQEASDGSRQVKVHIACPQCRGKYPMDISKVLLLRQAHSLGSSVVDDDGKRFDDSELTASQLSLKRDFFSNFKKRKVEKAHGLYLQVMDGKVSSEMIDSAEEVWQRLFAGLPEPAEGDEDDSDDDEHANGPNSPRHKFVIDDSLFKGLEDCMGRDEKVFLTQLLTSADVHKLTQASMILNGILKLSTEKPRAMLSNLKFENNQKNADHLEKTKRIFPLPNHMPGYFVLPSYNHSQKYLSLEDFAWDGSITPPPRNQRIFDMVYAKHYQPPSTEPHSVILVKTVRGPAGRVGLRKADVVTHINDIKWTGNSKELQDYIYGLYENHPNDELTLTVNANPETALFLQVRHELMEQSHAELI